MSRILQTIEADWHSRPTAVEFEMAYQARIASDRIKFAIRHIEQFAPQTEQMREAGLQLLDALQRLEIVDRRFQLRSRIGGAPMSDKLASDHAPAYGRNSEPSHRVVGK